MSSNDILRLLSPKVNRVTDYWNFDNVHNWQGAALRAADKSCGCDRRSCPCRLDERRHWRYCCTNVLSML